MANRVQALAVGVGPVIEVAQHVIDNATMSTIEIEYVKEFVSVLENPELTPEVLKAMMPVVCSWLNKQYCETGMLFRVDSRGLITFDYHSSGSQRDMIAALMCS